MNAFNKICLALIIVGGLNWLCVGLFSFNAVAWLCGGVESIVARIIFTVVGAAALCSIPGLFAPPPQNSAQ